MKVNVKKFFGTLTALFLLVGMFPCNAFATSEADVSAISWSGTKLVEKDEACVFQIGTAPTVGRFGINETENLLVSAEVFLSANGTLTMETVNGDQVLATAKLSEKKVHVSGDIKGEGFGAYEEGKWVEVKLLQNTKSGEYNVYIDDKAILLLEAQGTTGLPTAVKLTASDNSEVYAKNVTVSEYTPVENRIRTIYTKDELKLEKSETEESSYFFVAEEDFNTRVENAEHIRISFEAKSDQTADNIDNDLYVGLIEDSKISSHNSAVYQSVGPLFDISGRSTSHIEGCGEMTGTPVTNAFTINEKNKYVLDLVADAENTKKAAVTVRVNDKIYTDTYENKSTDGTLSKIIFRNCRNLVFAGRAKGADFEVSNIKVEVISSASAVYFEDFENTAVGHEPTGFTKYSAKTPINESFKVVDGSAMKSYTGENSATSVTGNSTHVAEFYQPQYTDSGTTRTLDGGVMKDTSVQVLASGEGSAEVVYIELPEGMKGADNLRLSFNLYNPINSINTNGYFNQKLRIGFNKTRTTAMAVADGPNVTNVIFDTDYHSVSEGVQKQKFCATGTKNGAATQNGFNALEWGNLTLELNRTYNDDVATGYNVTAYGRSDTATGTTTNVKDGMEYVMMQIPHDKGGKYYLDNLLIEKVCDADAFVGEPTLLAQGGVSYAVQSVMSADNGYSVSVLKSGTLPSGTTPTLYFAVYTDEGTKLKSVTTANLSQEFEGATKTISIAQTLETGDTYKVFIFDQGLVPMTTAYIQG